MARNTDPDGLVIPEAVADLSTDDLNELHDRAVQEFDAVYGDGSGLTPEALDALSALTEGIERLSAEQARRAEEQAQRDEAAQALAAKIRPEGENAQVAVATGEVVEVVEAEDEAMSEDAADAESVTEDEPQPAPVVASAPRQISVGNLSSLRRSAPRRPAVKEPSMRDHMFAGDVPGFTSGEGLDWDGVGRALDRRLAGFNQAAYSAAASAGRHLTEQHSVAMLRVPMPQDVTVANDSAEHVASVLRRATDESRLPGGSLVASGGWCAPSETVYDLCEVESRDGILSLPEIGIARGGIKFTKGPDFSTLYNNLGFQYSETNDIGGKYAVDANRVGTNATGNKPCYTVPCPTFEEARLDLIGLCLTAGLLQSRGYPEMLARVVRGALVAHDHRINAYILSKIAAGSTAVQITAGQAGATAPLLSSLELQVEDYKSLNRIARSTTLEAVMPYWVRGVVRADLSRRLGVDLLSVSDAMIDGWFRERGLSPQYVYDWQNLGTGTAPTSWPTTVDVLLYRAGTWVRGRADVITIDTLYDSVNLAKNDHTALFTEEGILVAQVCHDSRKISVPICPDGATHEGIAIACNGTGDKPTVGP